MTKEWTVALSINAAVCFMIIVDSIVVYWLINSVVRIVAVMIIGSVLVVEGLMFNKLAVWLEDQLDNKIVKSESNKELVKT